MRRRVVNVLAVVSAVVCVLSAGVVGRSFFSTDVIWVPIGQSAAVGAATGDGQLILSYRGYMSFSYDSAPMWLVRSAYDLLWRDLRGIRWLSLGWGTSFGVKHLILPLWVVPIVSAVLPVWWWRVRRRAGGRGFAVEVKGSSPATEETGDAE